MSDQTTLAALVILLGLVLRLNGITWQLPWRLHPDEPPHVEEAVTIASTLDFRPAYVNQPPLFRNVLALEIFALDRLHLMGGPLADAQTLADSETAQPNPVLTRAYALARVNSAIFGALTVLLVLASMRLIFGPTAAILGALTMALSLAHVRETHFATTTSLALCLSTLALYFSARFVARGGWGWIMAASVAVALSVWTRDLMLFSVAYPAAAVLVHRFQPREPRWWIGAVLVAVAGVAAMVLCYQFLLPYQNPEDVRQGTVVFYKVSDRGELRMPELWVAAAYAQTIAQSLTIPLLVAGLVGALIMIVREPRGALLFGSYFVLTLVGLMIHARPWLRFGIPLEVFLCVAAGWLLAQVIHLAARTRWWRPAMPAVLGLFLFPLINASYFGWVTAREDTRVTARNWIESGLPSRTLVYAPGFTLPNVRADMASGVPNPITHVWAGDIPTVVTGQGCGEVLALSTFALDPVTSSQSVENAREFAERQGVRIAEFSPGFGNSPLVHGQDDGFSPFWNLWKWSRPGPTVDMFQMSPPCVEGGPQHEPVDLSALTAGAVAPEVWRTSDERVTDRSPSQSYQAEGFPGRTRSTAVGSFARGDTPSLQAVLFDQYSRQRLGLYRVSLNQQPQLVMLDDDVVTGCQCVSDNGLAAADVDGDGVDELLVLRYELGIQSLDIYSLNASRPRLLHRTAVQDRGGRPASSLAYVPPDLNGPARVAFLFEMGSQYWIDVWPLDPHSPGYARPGPTFTTYLLPSSRRDLITAMAVSDFDGDGRNELAILREGAVSVDIFRLPAGSPGGVATLTHYERRGLPTQAYVIFTGTQAGMIPPLDQKPELLKLEEAGTVLEISGITLDRSTPYHVRGTQPAQLGRLRAKDVVGAAVGRFLDTAFSPGLIVMYQEGRTVTVELYPGTGESSFAERGIEVDRWRAQDTDFPLDASLVAADLDGDGVDELLSGRKTSPVANQYEIHAHRVRLAPRPSLEYIGRSKEVVPNGATFAALTRVRHVAGEPDQLAMVYLLDSQALVDSVDVRAGVSGPEFQSVRTQPWGPLVEEQIVSLAASGFENGYARQLAISLRSEAARQIEVASIHADGSIGPIQEIPWPDLRNPRATLTGVD